MLGQFNLSRAGPVSSTFSTSCKLTDRPIRQQIAVASYNNDRRHYGNATSASNERRHYGNTTSASNRAALTEALDISIDTSKEAVTTQSVPLPGQRKSYRVSVFDAMKFFGPAPERINGRLAMLGFLLGALNEVNSGMPVLEQALAAPVFTFAIVAIVSYASLVPIVKGARNEAFGFMTPKAEITNGRAAMLGIAVLLYLEKQAGASFF